MRIYILGLLLFMGQSLYAQVSKDTYETAVNYLNCKTIEASLTSEKEDLNKFKKECNCDEFSTLTFEKILVSIPKKYGGTLELSKEINSLINNYSNAANDPIRYLSQNAFNDKKKLGKLYAFKDKRKGEEFENVQKSITEGLNHIFGVHEDTGWYSSPDQTALGVEDESEVIFDRSQTSITNQEKAGWFGGLTFEFDIIAILISIITALILYAYLDFNFLKKSDEVPSAVKSYVSSKLNDPLFKVGSKQTTPNSEIRSLRDDLDKLKGVIRDLEKQINGLATKSINTHVTGGEKHIITPPILDKNTYKEREVFYLSNPNADESFNSLSISHAFRTGASIYRFTKIDDFRAEFQIDNREDAIKLALQFPDKNIDPACEPKNAFNPKAKSVYTSAPGKAELRADKWKVTSKAIIEYI
ncbi:hypothetical protein [uncultured Pontibacter sp.]|uniref:hypothetical protein n=1 Tax=uncultured Pontibacter sp. TaxID=453356 RepID=UPI0026021DCE|nr:hypothetical protein [uncultured Pontibacter sp.]